MARDSQVEHGANFAAVCSMPPSDVGLGITAWVGKERGESGALGRESGRKYMYICVVNLLGMLVGVIHRVKGINDSGPIVRICLRIPREKFEVRILCYQHLSVHRDSLQSFGL